jgi:hypothetical protein
MDISCQSTIVFRITIAASAEMPVSVLVHANINEAAHESCWDTESDGGWRMAENKHFVRLK